MLILCLSCLQLIYLSCFTFIDTHRETLGLSTETIEEHEYRKLEKALICGLPNEVDFAVNVCTLLSNDSRRMLKLKTCSNFLPLFMAHIGIFGDGKSFKCYVRSCISGGMIQ